MDVKFGRIGFLKFINSKISNMFINFLIFKPKMDEPVWLLRSILSFRNQIDCFNVICVIRHDMDFCVIWHKSIWLILVSKRQSGPQQSHPFIVLWLFVSEMFLKFNFTARYIWARIIWDGIKSHRAIIFIPRKIDVLYCSLLPQLWIKSCGLELFHYFISNLFREAIKKKSHSSDIVPTYLLIFLKAQNTHFLGRNHSIFIIYFRFFHLISWPKN